MDTYKDGQSLFLKIAAPIHHKRASSSHNTISDFFKNTDGLNQKLIPVKYPAMASRIWNCDETGFNTAVGSQQVLVNRASKVVHKTGGGSDRENITVHICGYGTGEMLPVTTHCV